MSRKRHRIGGQARRAKQYAKKLARRHRAKGIALQDEPPWWMRQRTPKS
jgi:hypothetical protein